MRGKIAAQNTPPHPPVSIGDLNMRVANILNIEKEQNFNATLNGLNY